eukprot:XP_020400254.1 formin-like protein 7 [Zea mays]
MGQVPRADPSIGAAIMPEETADAAVAPSPPDLLLAPASTPAGAVANSPAEPPITPEIGMVEEPPLVVVPDLPSLGHKERAAAVAEVGDRGPASLAKGRASASTAMVLEALTAGGPDTLGEGHAEPRPVLGSSVLIPKRHNPNEWCGPAFRFWSRGASEPLFLLNDEREEQGQLAETTEQLAEASARAGTLAEDLAVAMGSAQSAQAVASQERAQAEESVKALAMAFEQKEADRRRRAPGAARARFARRRCPVGARQSRRRPGLPEPPPPGPVAPARTSPRDACRCPSSRPRLVYPPPPPPPRPVAPARTSPRDACHCPSSRPRPVCPPPPPGPVVPARRLPLRHPSQVCAPIT